MINVLTCSPISETKKTLKKHSKLCVNYLLCSRLKAVNEQSVNKVCTGDKILFFLPDGTLRDIMRYLTASWVLCEATTF